MEEDKRTCCFFRCIRDVKPQPLDPQNAHQQFKIQKSKRRRGFTAKSISPNACRPDFLRRGSWTIRASDPRHFELQNDVFGLDKNLQSKLPNFEVPLTNKNSTVVVARKWYCPFMFIKESGLGLKDQMKQSMYYTMTLEQRWEQIFSRSNKRNNDNVVADAEVPREEVSLCESHEACEISYLDVSDGILWFRGVEEAKVGLSLAVVKKMRVKIESLGGGEGRKERVEIAQESKGEGKREKFECYILVGSFVLKWSDGSLALTYEFKQTHHTRSKWE